MGVQKGSEMLQYFGPLIRTELGMMYHGLAAAGRQRQRRAGVRVAGVPRRREQGRHGARDTLVERLSEVCRPDNNSKEA